MKKLLLLLSMVLVSISAKAESQPEQGYAIEASFVSTAPIRIIWAVLTDYDHIAEFVPNIVESKFTPPDRLYQKVRGRWWFVTKTLELDLRIKETLYNKIEFETVSSSDSFRIYKGAWELKEGDVVSINYVLLAEPNFFVPQHMIAGILKRETKNYIDSIQDEIKLRWDALKEAEKNQNIPEK